MVCIVLIGSLPASVSAGELDGLLGMISTIRSTQLKQHAVKQRNLAFALQLAQEIRSQCIDARNEVLFWFRTHPAESVFPKQEVERMINSGVYISATVSDLKGLKNPFSFEFSPEAEAFIDEPLR